MNRITEKMLENQIAYLNKITGMPSTPYDFCQDEGRNKPAAGNYHLSHSYGGVCLHRMSLTAGCTGVTTPLVSYHVTKRELYNAIGNFISGIEYEKAKNEVNL